MIRKTINQLAQSIFQREPQIILPMFAAVMLFFFCTSAFAKEVAISDTTIELPSVDGFAEVSSVSSETLEMFKDICPETMKK